MKKSWHVLLAALPLAVAVLAVILGLFRLSTPDPEQVMLYLGYTKEETNGWTFETEHGPAQPQLGYGGYFEGIAAQSVGPVSASRIMEDAGKRNLLEFGYFGAGIQVYLDDQLLYTDFPNRENRLGIYLDNVDPTDLGQETLFITLPESYVGKKLCVVTYGELWDGCRPVIFPTLLNRFSDAAVMSAGTVWDLAGATALALLAMLLLLVFMMGEHVGQRQWQLLPLAMYFLLMPAALLLRGQVAEAAGLGGMQAALDFVSLIYIDFLVLFLAMVMKGWRRWTLAAACTVHLLLSTSRTFWGFPHYADGFLQDPAGLMLVVISVALMLFSWKEKKLFRIGAAGVALAAGMMFLFWGTSRVASSVVLDQLSNPVNALLAGDPRAFYRILCSVISVICAVGVVIDFFREYLRRQKQEQLLLLRSQMAQESYAQALESISRTAAMRHEWKNQIISLHLLQKQGKTDELAQQLQELDTHLSSLTPRHYCDHFTINAIVQNAAGRAEKLGIHFQTVAVVPAELPFTDEELCSLLLNMLDNALEAAAQVADESKRSIQCAIRIRNGYLAIKCENSYTGALILDEHGEIQSTKEQEGIHGLGLLQMKAIAEKHGSMLDVSYTDECFIVQTALKM